MKRRCAIVLVAFFLCNAVFPGCYGTELLPQDNLLQDAVPQELTGKLTSEQIVVYNNTYDMENPCSPMVYVTKLTLMGTGLTLRAYDAADPQVRTLLGSYEVENTAHGFTVGIPVPQLSPYGGSVYVTIQQNGLAESEAVRADYGKAVSPSGELRVIKVKESVAYNTTSFANSIPLGDPANVKAGSYYLVDVMLKDFHTVGGATIPVRYNTNYLELVPILPSKLIDTASRVEAPNGEPFGFSKVGTYKMALQCGVLPGRNTDYGTPLAGDSYPNPPAGDPGEYPYVNTTTGLVKLEITKNRYGPFDYEPNTGNHTGSGAGEKSVVRLVFRAVRDGDEEINGSVPQDLSDLAHFATAADYEAATGDQVGMEGIPDNPQEAVKYYATQHPAGISVSLEDAQLLRTPPALQEVTVDFSKDNPVDLTAPEIPLLPESFEAKTAVLELPVNSIKVYNYTNATSMTGGLDRNLQDRLVLSPSQETGGVISGDLIRVYGDSGLGSLLGEGIADGEGAVSVELENKLSAAGGKVYVTNTRAGVGSSAVAFSYPAEANREIVFRIYRTSLPAGTAQGADPQKNPESLGQVKPGEQFQIKVFVNDVNDLMGYTLPIHFNAQMVQAADRYFRPITKDGYLSEVDFFNGRTPFTVGSDLSSLTTNELIIYHAKESEIPALMEELGIATREEWDAKKRDIGVKLDYGVSGGPGAWNGGLLFTGLRPGITTGAAAGTDGTSMDQLATVYPYVDNNVSVPNAAHDGLVKMWATSLTSPVERLSRQGGYHFLTMNFVGRTNVVGAGADFRFATAQDSVYDGANPQGGRLCLSGPEESAGKNVTVRWEVYSMEEIPIPTGTTVGGIVQSGSPDQDTVITVSQGGETVSTTTLGGVAAGSGQTQQSFLLEDLMPGTYTVRFHKESHVDVVLDNLEIQESAVDLTTHRDQRVRRIHLPCGDVDRDGNVGFLDRQRLLLSRYYGKELVLLQEQEREEAAKLDLDGDGLVKNGDLQILMAAINYGKSTVYIDMGE